MFQCATRKKYPSIQFLFLFLFLFFCLFTTSTSIHRSFLLTHTVALKAPTSVSWMRHLSLDFSCLFSMLEKRKRKIDIRSGQVRSGHSSHTLSTSQPWPNIFLHFGLPYKGKESFASKFSFYPRRDIILMHQFVDRHLFLVLKPWRAHSERVTPTKPVPEEWLKTLFRLLRVYVFEHFLLIYFLFAH